MKNCYHFPNHTICRIVSSFFVCLSRNYGSSSFETENEKQFSHPTLVPTKHNCDFVSFVKLGKISLRFFFFFFVFEWFEVWCLIDCKSVQQLEQLPWGEAMLYANRRCGGATLDTFASNWRRGQLICRVARAERLRESASHYAGFISGFKGSLN